MPGQVNEVELYQVKRVGKNMMVFMNDHEILYHEIS